MFVDPWGLHYEEVADALEVLVNAKSQMLSSSEGSREYTRAYQNAMQAKEKIRQDVVYIENLGGLKSTLSPIVEGDNNSVQSLKDAGNSVKKAMNSYNIGRVVDDVVLTGALTVVGAVAIKAGIAAIVSKLAPAASTMLTVDPNKINHIFNKAEHNLSPLVQKFRGNVADAYIAVQNAAQKVVNSKGLSGVFDSVDNPIVVKVKGFVVNVGGNVIDGILKIGTFYIK